MLSKLSCLRKQHNNIESILASTLQSPGGGGGGLPYKSDGDARRKIRINTLKETNLGVAPALFNP